MRIRSLNHSVYQTVYHIVWSTKYRRKLLKPYICSELIKSFSKIVRKHPNWYIHKINTNHDHVHLLVEVPPTYAISKVVRILKTYSSHDLRSKFKFIDKAYDHSGVWSVGYFVSTVGLNEAQIRRYITYQSKQDVGSDLTQEFS